MFLGTERQPRRPACFTFTDALIHFDYLFGPPGSGVYDTGAGTTLGRYKYHINIYLKFPHFVKAWIDFEKDDYDKLEIEGFDGQDWGPDVKWVIIYYFTYVKSLDADSTSSGLFIGLSTTMVYNTIIGLPHIRGTGLIYHPESNVVWSSLFQIYFDVTYERTDNRDALPMTAESATILVARPSLGLDISNGVDQIQILHPPNYVFSYSQGGVMSSPY